MHILPSALWAVLIPVQLNPIMRKCYRRAHRLSGYAFFLTGLVMMIGFAIIDLKGLDFTQHDFADMRNDDIDANLSRIGLGWFDHALVARCLSVWFVPTAALALFKA